MIFQAEVVIVPREGVLDTQGKAVEKTLSRLGYEGLEEVRVGRIVRIRMSAADEATAKSLVENMCNDLLANELIETYRIEMETARS